MEDTHTKRMIDAAKMVHGLYTLITPLVSIATNPINHCINVTNNTHLNSTVEYNKWHMIFTHPSYEKLIAINKKIPFEHILYFILNLENYSSLEMLSFLNTFFLINHNQTMCPNLHVHLLMIPLTMMA
jgi:hypothetical protein